jgi:uncharacterized protein YggE
MPKSGAIALSLVFCSLAFGQLESNSITVSASNNASLQADQADFSIGVQSSLTTSLENVLAALQGSGITAANLSSVDTVEQYANGSASSLVLEWTFSLPVSLANTKAIIASLTTLQQSIGAQNSGLTLSFAIAGTQVSPQLAQSQTCSLSGLIASATTQAQSLASAGGLVLGSITALASSTSNVVANPYATAPPCAITVTFSVARR